MFSLHLTCAPEDVDLLSADLWDYGTAGIREMEDSDGAVRLIAVFGTNEHRLELLDRFACYAPEWEREDATDWIQHTHEAWPARQIGERIFLAPQWSNAPTPPGRVRVRHNPGLACGTGEHPCSQLALMALETHVLAGSRVVDVGTGSGILAIAALQLGAGFAVGLDTDVSALQAARENFGLNSLEPVLVGGSIECLANASAELTVANISGTVLLSIFDDLLRVTAPGGRLLLTGFNESELSFFLRLLPGAEVSEINEWRCVAARISDLD